MYSASTVRTEFTATPYFPKKAHVFNIDNAVDLCIELAAQHETAALCRRDDANCMVTHLDAAAIFGYSNLGIEYPQISGIAADQKDVVIAVYDALRERGYHVGITPRLTELLIKRDQESADYRTSRQASPKL
ncbi:MAG: hypothetical protein KJ601_06240 [Nanoarchaeota archaeon]|nr:hypothetical protein [Nanoarchaeota archaeon]MBU1704115.1 hypothetical protein [Nanoarchaeota archaeon]